MGKKKPVEIQCSRCNGTGSVQLAFVHADTLELIRGRGKKGTTITELCAASNDCAYTTMSQRLVRLEALGLITLDRMSGPHLVATVKERSGD